MEVKVMYKEMKCENVAPTTGVRDISNMLVGQV